MKKISVFLSAAILFIACDKDSFETKPTLKVESVSSNVVPKGSSLGITLSFTDKEGDVSDTLFIIRQRTNIRGMRTAAASPYRIPTFPNESKGEIALNLDYVNDLTFGFTEIRIPGTTPSQFEPDSMNLRFVLKDKAGNKSDTASTSVVVLRQ
jgi:hypothetical protein